MTAGEYAHFMSAAAVAAAAAPSRSPAAGRLLSVANRNVRNGKLDATIAAAHFDEDLGL